MTGKRVSRERTAGRAAAKRPFDINLALRRIQRGDRVGQVSSD
jgi:hypothetical protein